MTEKRLEVLKRVAELVPDAAGEDCVRVAVDGVDSSGKTVFADELAAVLRSLGRYVVRVSVDDFHNVRSTRYRRGRLSPEGFWLDSFNYDRLRADVLAPLGPGGSRRYRSAAHDLTTDEILDPAQEVAPPGAVLVADGLFLHRDELAGSWGFSIFLDVPFEVTAPRMAERDGTSPDPNHPTMQRYVGAQQLYFAACTPHQRATLLVDNTTFATPHLVRVPD
ncbi:uridine kinase [Kribbella sp. NPDC049174]|uniref:uridine kinase n=1 Tax=Kribbella sp. NPDC049174 TaxID=3364112 RepID=UPI00370F936B